MAKQTENKVGIYLRLSQEDLREGDSVSIDNQRMILTNGVMAGLIITLTASSLAAIRKGNSTKK